MVGLPAVLNCEFLNSRPKGNPMNKKTITIAELRLRLLNELNAMDDEDEVTFGGGQLSLYRPKDRGPVTGKRMVDIEFNEVFTVTVQP
jgi:hypothetical protein